MLLIVILIVTTIYMVIMNGKIEKTITYFPINEENQFKEAATSLNLSQATNTVHWHVKSVSDQAAYLRQDVALLYVNGSLKGVLNKWEQQVKKINQAKSIIFNEDPHYLQAISFHHGEFHDQNEITSIQQLSKDEIYLYKGQEKVNKSKIKQETNILLQGFWDKLINKYHINEQEYITYPLIEISELSRDLKATFSSNISESVTGRLWEGLYKNYILEAVQAKANDMMPLILLAKDYSHLIVLYSINGENNKLIQRLQVVD